MRIIRLIFISVGLVLVWQTIVLLTHAPPYILPGPASVAKAALTHAGPLFDHAMTTLFEIIAGLLLGTLLGTLSALSMIASLSLKRWLLPVLVISQAIPVFALAPLLVLWFGYGMSSKIAMAVLIIFFPVTAAFYDGLRSTEPEWLELAQVMNAKPLAVIRHIRIPAALPAFASGLRVATAVAPIGAVVGEWVGSSRGLGFYMLHANARMQIDIMFAALVVLGVLSLTIYFSVDWAMIKIVYWQKEEAE
ncbi:MAG: ABC transporter permease [Deltaproteobacteria bacterium]|jgi:putative hydroxymethylpyrimidine transport system permease protein|nr:ABC transporter permease [Deltaproteobacteria bacterium]MBW2158313.1 ABC transporter permease [Deltaproteobacteria bacterium]MBW2228517.1 ABC transporter permease [Deltaproteobacteria bacterium]MBW2325562.1 ABC transporter permease [Deltaproteobacteria bacterium]